MALLDPELSLDFAETLRGIEPEELLSQEPDLLSVAEELSALLDQRHFEAQHLDDDSWRFQDITDLDDVSSQLNIDSHSHMLPAPSPSGSSEASFYSSGVGSPSQAVPTPSKTSQHKQAECVVCGRMTRAFRQFGAVVCPSCRAFFARAIKNNAFKDFACITGRQNCLIDSKSWVSCQLCRFNKCTRMGMKVTPKKGKKVVQKRSFQSEGLFPKKLYERFVSSDVIVSVMLMLGPSLTLTSNETMDLHKFTKDHMKLGSECMYNLIKSNLEIFETGVRFFYRGVRYPLKMQKTVDDYFRYIGIRFSKEDSPYPWDDLKEKDRVRLWTGNFPLMGEFMMAYKMWKSQECEDEIKEYLSEAGGEDEDFRREVNRIFKKTTKNGRLRPLPCKYSSIYDRGEMCLDTEDKLERHRKAAFQLARLGSSDPSVGYDPIHLILTNCVIMYTTDFLDLDEPKKAERIQAGYASLLHRYLKSKNHPNGDAMFRESMLACSYARELREFRDKAYLRLKP